MTEVGGVAIVLFAYNRPHKTRSTIRSLQVAVNALAITEQKYSSIPIYVSVDGPKHNQEDKEAVAEVALVVRNLLPSAKLSQGKTNRGLPAHLVETLDYVLSEKDFQRLICIEDDVELSPNALVALLTASDLLSGSGYVIGAAPLHSDGSVEHQALLLDRKAHLVAGLFLREYIARFALDGEQKEGAYGNRAHSDIYLWATEIAAGAGVPNPTGTSQDRMRELAWRMGNIKLDGLPTRMVRHRGYWGQHNTPWYALRTGQFWQRLDTRPWELVKREVALKFTQR